MADDFFFTLEGLSSNPSVVMVAVFAIFAVVHSGLAYLRPYGVGAASGGLSAQVLWLTI